MRSLSRHLVVPASSTGGAGTGTVTHSAGALTADQLTIGNGAADLKALGAAGTAVQVLHGNAAGAPTFGAVALATDVTGILPSANGGTGNGFTKVSGPAASEKTFTLPNASAVVLTDNAAVTIAQGGTGQATQAAAFDALSPTSARGDLSFRNATTNARLPKGTAGQFLTIGANDPAWGSVPGLAFMFGAGAAAGHSPVDATTYYFATPFTTNPGSTDGGGFVWIPVACTLRSVYFRANIFGVAGSSENVQIFLRINSTTDVTVTTTAQFTSTSASGGTNEFSNLALSTALAAGDKVAIKMVCPTWVTNPTIVLYQAQIYCDVP